MDDQKFKAGELRHKRLITFFQFATTAFTAVLVSAVFNDIPPELDGMGISRWVLIIISISFIIALLIFFNWIFNSLETALGWGDKEEENEDNVKTKPLVSKTL